ncbi:MAG: hypothetical protein ABI760_14575 [Ferruginibacter sp.]
MKKLLFVFVFALIGIANTYANNPNGQALQIKGMHNTMKINSNRNENPAIESFSIAAGNIASQCRVWATITSGSMSVTVSATAATCKEARAALDKIIAPLR